LIVKGHDGVITLNICRQFCLTGLSMSVEVQGNCRA
jgi:hypothetical protein